MRTIKTLILILLVVSLNEVNGQEYGITKSIEIQSEELGQSRKIFVYTPTNYDENLYSKYDVIFVFDAQNKQFFDLTQSSLPFLNDFDSANPHIVVGITATWIDSEEKTYGRNDDLLPKPINVAYNKNYFGNNSKITKKWYVGKTGIIPVDTCIKNAFETGYLHHIERLMVMGNYMNLSGIKPQDGFKWFMEFSCDSYEWVMHQNVYDMVFFVSGGATMRRPYISSSNYILKMSNYKKGEWSAIWDKKYKNFLKKNNDKLWKFRYHFRGLIKLKC